MCYEIPPLAFTVTSHKESYYDTPPAGRRVYEDEKLISGLNRGFEKEVECSIKGNNESLSFDNGNLEISFNRTIRVPDGGKEYQLPPQLGKFPIFNIADYEKKLPADMGEKGGVFIPMYQREAMWMSFYAQRTFAIKIYLGGVNGISGEPMIPNMATYLKRANKAARKQDYIVVPSQPWLDGVAVSPGLVKQFVAMPFGSGYSVEKQVTGEESVGGMQFEVIPTYDEREYFITRKQFFEEMMRMESLGAMVTAKSLGLQPGEMIYCKKIKETEMRVRTVKDLLSDSGALLELDLCKLINGTLRVRVLGDSEESSYSIHVSFLTKDIDMMFMQFKGQCLQDGRTLGHYGVADGDSLRLEVNPPQKRIFLVGGCLSSAVPKDTQMAIAVGGTIKQTINPDWKDPESWNTENVKLVNVQVVNSVAFEDITGMVAPKTPISPEIYAAMGLPFFEFYREQPSTVSGDFSKVKTVSEMDAVLQVREDAVYNPAVPQMTRPCNHCICKQCGERVLKVRDPSSRRCPQCKGVITRIVGISAPMNAPGHEGRNEPFKVITLNITDRRERFTSIKQQVGRG
ncbi:hypothetical protein DFP73DRAFT_474792 [Morchella snyderi]|nr:hypothetical protein DFP73DRAFT_474792 [Morchella snyderi]